MKRTRLVLVALLVGLAPMWRIPTTTAAPANSPAAAAAGWTGTFTQEVTKSSWLDPAGTVRDNEHWTANVSKGTNGATTYTLTYHEDFPCCNQQGGREIIDGTGSGTLIGGPCDTPAME